HFCELELHALELADRLAKLLPLLHVAQRRIEGTLRDTDHLGTNADAALVERLDRDLVALSHRTQHIGRRHPAVLEDQLDRAGGADAELLLTLADAETGEVALDDESGDALVALRRID